MKRFSVALLLASALTACNGTPSMNHQPVTGDQPAPVDTTAGLDTTGTGTGVVLVPTRQPHPVTRQKPARSGRDFGMD